MVDHEAGRRPEAGRPEPAVVVVACHHQQVDTLGGFDDQSLDPAAADLPSCLAAEACFSGGQQRGGGLVLLAVAALCLAAFNGLNLLELIANHQAIGIMDALVLAPIGALIVVGDRRHLLAWLLLADGLVLGALNVAEQYAPLALGLTPQRLSLPGGELASWVASWAFVPAS
jgi:hypothetical protein